MSGTTRPAASGHARIAAIVLNYRSAGHTLACLRSIPRQTVERVIVWDNSGDGGASARELAGLIAAEPAAMRAIEQIASPANLGFAAGVNAAISRIDSSGSADYLLLLNNDAVLPEGAVQGLLAALERQPDAVAVAPRVRTAGSTRGLIHHHRWLAIQTSHAVPGSFPYATGCCLLLVSGSLRRPLFDEAFFMYSEDVALGWHIHRGHQEIAVANDVVVEHAGAASSSRGSAFYEYHTARGHFVLTQRLALSPIQHASMAVTRTLALFTRATVRTIRSGSRIPLVQTWRAFRDAILLARRRRP